MEDAKPMTPDEVQKAAERAEKATKGPWRACSANETADGPRCPCGIVWAGEAHVVSFSGQDPEHILPANERNENWAFVTAAREDVPRLVATVRQLEAERDSEKAKVAVLTDALQAAKRAASMHCGKCDHCDEPATGFHCGWDFAHHEPTCTTTCDAHADDGREEYPEMDALRKVNAALKMAAE